MELNLEPVKVDLQIETPSLERGAFYSLCFITENDEAPRTLEVNTLSDLLENGYTREDLAYNFCVGVFAQQGIQSVYIRAKRSYETYEEAFSSDSNDDYYYLVIESKDSEVISDFNDFVVSSDDYKLQFYSSNEEPVEGRKLVHYFFDRGSDKNDFYLNKVMGDPDYLENVETPPDVDRDGLVFTVQDINIGQDAFTVWSSANAPLGNFQWSLENLDTGTVVASSDGTLSEGFLVENSELSLNVTIPVDEKATRYEFKSEGRWIGLDCIPQNEAFSEGINVLSGQPKYRVVIEQYAKNFISHTFYLSEADLTVPDTLPSHITECDEMFSGCQFFNQDISSWDVSAVEIMDSMFIGCESFNQDLSQWCVSLISESPDSFSSGSALTEENLPVWGTCPRGENGLIEEDEENYEGDEPVRITYDATNVYPNSTVFKIYISRAYKKWEIRKLGEVVFNSDMTSPNFTLVANSDTNTNIQLVNFEGGVDSLEVYSKGEAVSFEVTSNLGRATSPEITVESFGSVIQNMTFDTKDCPITLPVELPPNITSLDNMFYNCGGYISDITSWDTTNIVSMDSIFSANSSFNQDISNWNTENVLSMRTAFYNCTSFNQDLSSWCVTKIPVKPDYFDLLAGSWTLPRPDWGTCPRGEASNLRMFTVDPFDESYSVATRLSQRVGEEPKLTAIQLQQQRLAYPEGAWIGLCGNVFPSRVNWLHKNLIKSDIRKINSKPKLPELSSTTMLVIKKRATVGSGLTTQGIVIHEQVSLDWIKWALGRKVWKTLYSNERINATTEGLELIANDVKEVLNLALEEEMLSEYQITEVLLDRYTNNLSLKFSCRLMETILFVDISGSLYY